MLQLNEENENDIQPIIHSPYYDMGMLKLLTEQNNGCFSILSSHVESINDKMNEIEAFVEELSQMHFKFTLICFQECWLSDRRLMMINRTYKSMTVLLKGKHVDIKVAWSCTLTIVLITR